MEASSRQLRVARVHHNGQGPGLASRNQWRVIRFADQGKRCWVEPGRRVDPRFDWKGTLSCKRQSTIPIFALAQFGSRYIMRCGTSRG